MAVQVYGSNHVAIEVDDAEKAMAFYSDVFNLELLRGGEGAAWCKLGEHQFLAIFEVKELRPDRVKHFGIMVRDDAQINARRSPRSMGSPWNRTSAVIFETPGAIASKSWICTTSRWYGCCRTEKFKRRASSSTPKACRLGDTPRARQVRSEGQKGDGMPGG